MKAIVWLQNFEDLKAAYNSLIFVGMYEFSIDETESYQNTCVDIWVLRKHFKIMCFFIYWITQINGGFEKPNETATIPLNQLRINKFNFWILPSGPYVI